MIWLYNGLVPAARLGTRIWAWRDPKLARGLEARRGAEARLRELAPKLDGPLLWLHSTSAGEYEQARPIAALWSAQRPDWRILHTFTSPSGHDYARRLGEARFLEFLPEDSPGRTGRVLDALRPRVLIFVKWDVWPNLVVQAHARRIPVVLVDATLRAESPRSRWPVRGLYRQLYERMRLISAVSERDAERFRGIAPAHPNVVVDGDTRFDQVMRRRREADRLVLPEALARRSDTFTWIAGSTWEPDEERVIPAFAALVRRSDGNRLRLLLVPHEPLPARVAALEAQLARLGLASVRFSQLERDEPGNEDSPRVVLVDRVGVLAELYARADAAYVGGAFTTGVHNVMEPAIMGLPVFFGPRYDGAPEAEGLMETGAAAVVHSADELERRLHAVMTDASVHRRMGDRARAYVEANLGASERCVARLRAVVERDSPAREGS